jgi:hypothetical protein
MGLEIEGIGMWTYPAKPPEEPYVYILDDEGIVYNPNITAILGAQVQQCA